MGTNVGTYITLYNLRELTLYQPGDTFFSGIIFGQFAPGRFLPFFFGRGHFLLKLYSYNQSRIYFEAFIKIQQ